MVHTLTVEKGSQGKTRAARGGWAQGVFPSGHLSGLYVSAPSTQTEIPEWGSQGEKWKKRGEWAWLVWAIFSSHEFCWATKEASQIFLPLGTPCLLPRISVANSWAHLFLWPGKLPLIPPLPLSQLPLALLEVRQHSTAHFETDLFPNCPPSPQRSQEQKGQEEEITHVCVCPSCLWSS